jgi:hypothetical protein
MAEKGRLPTNHRPRHLRKRVGASGEFRVA